MLIKSIQIEYTHKSGFSTSSYDHIRHIKSLPYLSIVQAVEGNYDIQLNNGRQYNTGARGFFIAPSDVQQTIIHNADQISNKMVCRWVFLKVKINELYDFDTLFDFPIVLPEPYKSQMHILFDKLFAAGNVFDEYVCYYEIVRLLSLASKERQVKSSPYLEAALSYIKANYHRHICVHDIAKEVNLSESHLYSVFKSERNLSPIAFLNNHRLSIAAEALLNTDKTIIEISNAVGIPDSVYFNKLFRKAYQMSPSQYRKIHKTGSV